MGQTIDEARFSLRIPRDLLERLHRVAEQEERSVNTMMVRLLRKQVEQEEANSRR